MRRTVRRSFESIICFVPTSHDTFGTIGRAENGKKITSDQALIFIARLPKLSPFPFVFSWASWVIVFIFHSTSRFRCPLDENKFDELNSIVLRERKIHWNSIKTKADCFVEYLFCTFDTKDLREIEFAPRRMGRENVHKQGGDSKGKARQGSALIVQCRSVDKSSGYCSEFWRH